MSDIQCVRASLEYVHTVAVLLLVILVDDNMSGTLCVCASLNHVHTVDVLHFVMYKLWM